MRAPVLFFLLGVVVRTVWYVVWPHHDDWDPAYYESVARTLATTGRATVDVVWNYTWLPEALQHPADMHWMPLPSRVLVPLMALSPRYGAGATSILLGACWGPLAWAVAGRLDRPALDRNLAGLLGALGFSHVAMSAIPDSAALSGVIGGLITLAVADRRPWLTMLLCALLALTRNDGFLLAPCVALAFRGPWAIGVAISGGLGTAGWYARCFWLGGAEWLEARRMAGSALDGTEWLLGHAEAATLADRFGHLMGDGLVNAVFHVLVVLPILATVVLPFIRTRWTRALAVYWFGYPLLIQFLAPAISSSGSVFRSGAVLIPLAAAVSGAALGAIGRWSERLRDYHPAFLSTLFALGWVAFIWAIGPASSLGGERMPSSCAADLDPTIPAFSLHPLLGDGRCGRPGLMIREGMDLERVEWLSDRYGVEHAVAHPADLTPEGGLDRDEMRALLVGWEEIRPGVFRR